MNNRERKLAAALVKCRRQFLFYADEHAKKGSTEKEETNRNMAAMIDEALEASEPRVPVTLRFPKSLSDRLHGEAVKAGMPLSQYIVQKLEGQS